jgi:putative transposase
MEEDTVVRLPRPGAGVDDDPLLVVLREGARRMLTQAIEAEVEAFLAVHTELEDAHGRRRVVRNGHAPARHIQTGVGPIEVRRPRVRDRGDADHADPIRFTSKVLPPYLRRTRNLEELLPWLYLKGISTGQFEEALTALLGADAPGLSASTVRRLTEAWQEEHERWQRRDLSARRYVYLWADGVYFTPRLEHDRQCILVLIGADASGRKELLAIEDGYRESAQSWREVLLRLRDANGLALDPELATGDGALGFWQALHEVWPKTRQQRSTMASSTGAQDCQRAERPAEVGARQSQAGPTRDLRGRGPRRGRGGLRPLRREVRAQVRQGGRMPGQGPRSPAGLLCGAGRALEARPDDQPHREHFRHGPATDGEDERLPVAADRAGDGLQAGQVC